MCLWHHSCKQAPCKRQDSGVLTLCSPHNALTACAFTVSHNCKADTLRGRLGICRCWKHRRHHKRTKLAVIAAHQCVGTKRCYLNVACEPSQVSCAIGFAANNLSVDMQRTTAQVKGTTLQSSWSCGRLHWHHLPHAWNATACQHRCQNSTTLKFIRLGNHNGTSAKAPKFQNGHDTSISALVRQAHWVLYHSTSCLHLSSYKTHPAVPVLAMHCMLMPLCDSSPPDLHLLSCSCTVCNAVYMQT